MFSCKKTKMEQVIYVPKQIFCWKRKNPQIFSNILYGLLSSMPQKIWGSIYRKSVCKAIIELVVNWNSFDFWYVQYHVVDGASFLGLIQLVSDFSSWVGSHCICRHKTSQKIIIVLYILVLTIGNFSYEFMYSTCNTISTVSNYVWKDVLRAVITCFQKLGKECATTETGNWPVHKQNWSLYQAYLSLQNFI